MSVPDERSLLWRCATFVVGLLLRAGFRLRVAGVSRVPITGSAVIAANHVSALDGVVLGFVVSEHRRRVTRFLAAAEFFRRRLVGPALRILRQIPLRRGAHDAGALEEAIAALRAGAIVGIFPEGRVGAGIELQPGHSGVARIALAADAPVIPAGIWGTQHRWPRSGLHLRRPWRPGLAVVFGEPIAPTGDPERPEDLGGFLERVMAGIDAAVEAARELAKTR